MLRAMTYFCFAMFTVSSTDRQQLVFTVQTALSWMLIIIYMYFVTFKMPFSSLLKGAKTKSVLKCVMNVTNVYFWEYLKTLNLK